MRFYYNITEQTSSHLIIKILNLSHCPVMNKDNFHKHLNGPSAGLFIDSSFNVCKHTHTHTYMNTSEQRSVRNPEELEY